MITLQPIASSNIAGVAYNTSKRSLLIGFKGKRKSQTVERVYEYSNVPPDIYRLFMEAPSKGQFFRGQIKDIFDFRLLDEDAVISNSTQARKPNTASAAMRMALEDSNYHGTWF
ncbi:MAG: KTSC domain-containing protein [Gammaproteobacteria bacterium]|nr:KTSC domain-containing protein [Gammaproteobacteria bacterium]